MDDTWWVDPDQLHPDQEEIVQLPLDGNYLISGPAGSGKSNLLLLRAGYLNLQNKTNILVIVFTRALANFLHAGATNYDFDSSKIITAHSWTTAFIQRYGEQPSSEGSFEEVRRERFKQIDAIIAERKIGQVYQSIILDEAHDYYASEIAVFQRLTRRLVAAVDERQAIYQSKAQSIDALKRFCVQYELHHHYRCGPKICKVADGLSITDPDGHGMLDSCNYDHVRYPDSVELLRAHSLDAQVDRCIDVLKSQLAAYPGAILAVLAPRRSDVDAIWSRLEHDPELADVIVRANARDGFDLTGGERIVVGTIHAAKGLEFRCVHLLATEELSCFAERLRNVAFVAVTRARTSLRVYYSGRLDAEVESAVLRASTSPTVVDVSKIFRSKP